MQKETRMGQNWRRLKRIEGGVFDRKLFLTSRFWKFISLVYSCKYKRLWETHELDYRDTVHLNEDSCVALTIRGGSRIFFRRGCTRLLPTPINHIVFFSQNTSCIRKPQVISGGRGVRTPCTLPLDPPMTLKLTVKSRVVYLDLSFNA